MGSNVPEKKWVIARFTTLERYLVKQVVWMWVVATPVLITLLLALRISKMMAKSVAGQIPLEHVWQLVWLKVPAYMGMVIPMTLFFSVLLAFGRLYQESEVTAFRAGGVDIFRASRGVRWFSVGVATVVTMFVLFVTPWAQTEINNIHDEINANANLVGLTPGRFKSLSGKGERIFYAEEISVDQRDMRGVFFYESVPPDRFRIITSRFGQLLPNENGDGKWLVMREGRQYGGRPGDADVEIVDFEEYGVKLDLKKSTSGEPSGRAIPFQALWGSERLQYKAELQWRLSLPVMTVLLVFLAVPLSRTSPRGGKYAGMVPGILLYLLFSNLFNISYGWIERGVVESWMGMSWVYLSIVVLIFILYLRDGISLRWRGGS
ncbi:MAG: LPS export ABC transporter permease LptF [Gammaproteobacteria bacterium]|uniref:Lipopolysaccharide export system permease protein LptF n=1 Tax=Candidatus Thiopontia autotrophica TaxID=2841688 RepID=A0A8J6P8X1_9GAMM|nr:LPS export ABC transporter permease LptF [Candidatus Thiopontia autotrophica]